MADLPDGPSLPVPYIRPPTRSPAGLTRRLYGAYIACGVDASNMQLARSQRCQPGFSVVVVLNFVMNRKARALRAGTIVDHRHERLLLSSVLCPVVNTAQFSRTSRSAVENVNWALDVRDFLLLQVHDRRSIHLSQDGRVLRCLHVLDTAMPEISRERITKFPSQRCAR